MTDSRYPPQTDVPSQGEPTRRTYYPAPNVSPQPDVIPGTPPRGAYTVANFDSRPLNSYDAAWRIQTTLQPVNNPTSFSETFTTPAGYVCVLRGITLEGFYENTTTVPQNVLLIAGSGRVGQDFPFGFDYIEYQIRANGVPLPLFPSFDASPITGNTNEFGNSLRAMQLMTDIYNIELFFPLNDDLIIDTAIIPGPNYIHDNDIVTIYTTLHATLIASDGLDPSEQVVNTFPIPVMPVRPK